MLYMLVGLVEVVQFSVMGWIVNKMITHERQAERRDIEIEKMKQTLYGANGNQFSIVGVLQGLEQEIKCIHEGINHLKVQVAEIKTKSEKE